MFQCRNQDFWLLYGDWRGWALILSLQPELKVFVKLLCIFISFLSLQNRPQAQIPPPKKKKKRHAVYLQPYCFQIIMNHTAFKGIKGWFMTLLFILKVKRSETEFQNSVLLPLTILWKYVLRTTKELL